MIRAFVTRNDSEAVALFFRSSPIEDASLKPLKTRAFDSRIIICTIFPFCTERKHMPVAYVQSFAV